MVEGVDIKVEWEELIDSFSEDASTLQILSACINKFGDGGCGLSFSDWGAIVRNHLEEKELQSESFWDNFEYADSSDDDYYYSEKEDTDEDLLPIDVSIPLNIEENLSIDDESNNVLRIYMTEALKYRQLTNEESVKLLKRYKNGDSKAYDILVKSNLRFAIYVVQWYKGKGIAYEDLIQEAVLGILRAIQNADPSYRNFTDYIKTFVFQTVSTAGAFLPHLIKIPANQVRTHRRVGDFINKYELQYGYEPSLMEIEDYFYEDDIDVATVYKFPRDLTDFTYSFDDWETIEDNLLHVDDFFEQEHNKTFVKRLLNSLPYRESLILKKYYGIDEKIELSLEDIGKDLFLTRERVRQIHSKTLSKLRKRLDSKEIVEYPVEELEESEEIKVISVEEITKERSIDKKKSTVANPLPVKRHIRPIFNIHFEENDAQVIPTIKRHTKFESPIDIGLQISQINSIALNGGHKIPHKAIYILTLIKGIREGFINPNEIYLDDRLITTFNLLWNKYVPAYSPFVSGIANPFMLLSTEKFYHLKLLKPTNLKGKNWTIDTVREVCEFAYVSEEFIDYISKEENRKRILEILTNNFNLNLSSESEEKIQEIPVIEEAKIVEEENIVKTEVPTLPKPKILNRYWAALLRLSYPNGILEESSNFSEMLVNFIKYAGSERVAKLNLHSSGVNIMARKEEISPEYSIFFKDVGNGYLINIFLTHKQKYEVMSFISEVLNLGIKVEFVEKPRTTRVKIKEASLRKDVESTQGPLTESRSGDEPQISLIEDQERTFNSNISIEDTSATPNIVGKSETTTIEEPEINIVKEENIVKAEVPTLPKPEFLNQRGTTLLRLTYPNGYVEESDTYTDVFTEFVKYAGPKRVRELNIYSLGVNLIVRKEEIPAKYKSGFKDVGNGYFLNTVSATQRKYEVMSFISEKLNLGVKVELVARGDSTKAKVQKATHNVVHKEVKATQSSLQKQQDDTDLLCSIIDYITRYPNSKASNIADYLGVPRKEINSILYRLQKEGRCEINAWFQWRIAEVPPPVSVVKEPAQVYKSKPSASKYIDTFAYGRIFSMRFSTRDGYKAPHKAIYLLSIIDCVELGEIKSRRFDITSLLLKRFEENWNKYVHHDCFSPTIWNPIFYMEDDIIHKEWNSVFVGTKPNSLDHCELIFEYLEIASDLWRALQDEETREKLKAKIIDCYIINNRTSSN